MTVSASRAKRLAGGGPWLERRVSPHWEASAYGSVGTHGPDTKTASPSPGHGGMVIATAQTG